MKTQIYLIRHVHSESNALKICAGTTDSLLDETGIHQLKYIEDYMKEIELDKILFTSFLRTRKTAEAIQGGRDDILMVETNELREMNFGVWDGLYWEDIKNKYPKDWKIWLEEPLKVNLLKGETIEEVSNRAFNAFWKIVNQERGKTVAYVSHRAVLQILLIRLQELDLSLFWEMPVIKNASVTLIEVNDNDDIEIIKYGYVDYLPKELKVKPKLHE